MTIVVISGLICKALKYFYISHGDRGFFSILAVSFKYLFYESAAIINVLIHSLRGRLYTSYILTYKDGPALKLLLALILL